MGVASILNAHPVFSVGERYAWMIQTDMHATIRGSESLTILDPAYERK